MLTNEHFKRKLEMIKTEKTTVLTLWGIFLRRERRPHENLH